MSSKANDQFTLVNLFTPKPGAIDQFLQMQLDDTAQMRDNASAAGWLNNEVYRTRDGERLIVVTRFANAESQAKWTQTAQFLDHRARIAPMLDIVESIPVVEVARHVGPNRPTPFNVAVIVGSTRAGRFADKPAEWIAAKAAAHGAFTVSTVDLRDFPLPFFGDLDATAEQKQTARRFGEQIDHYDAFIFTAAEYNHAPTAVLKNALDHASWKRKSAGFVGYGGVGGARAVEHLRTIAAELEMAPMQTAVHITFADYLALSKGQAAFPQMGHLEAAAGKMLDQLAWWTSALTTARSASEPTSPADMAKV